jgi:hypothetical protein
MVDGFWFLVFGFWFLVTYRHHEHDSGSIENVGMDSGSGPE